MAAPRSRALPPLPTTNEDENKRPDVKRRRTKNTRVACLACQKRKSACDGERPVCHQCAARVIDCVYETLDPNESRSEALKREFDELKNENHGLKHQNHELIHVKDQLMHQNDELVLKVQQLQLALQERMPPPSQNTAKSTQARPLPNETASLRSDTLTFGASRLSDHATARAILPRTSSRLEYEVQVSHPGIYQMSPTIGIASSSRVSVQPAYTLSSGVDSQPMQPPLVGPLPVPEYPDRRLASLRMTFWSKVPIPDDTAARIISLYLISDHAISSFFDPDLFLDDLVNCGVQYCSPVLVSSLLFWACVSENRG